MEELGDGVFGNDGALRLGPWGDEFLQLTQQRRRIWEGQTLLFQLLTLPFYPGRASLDSQGHQGSP